MQIWLKNVSAAWAKVAEQLAAPQEVNLWRVGPEPRLGRPAPGDLLLFRREGRERTIIGYGRYVATTRHTPEDNWALFKFANGAWSLEQLLQQVAARRKPSDCGSAMLTNTLIAEPVFFPPLNPYELPPTVPHMLTTAPLFPSLSRAGRILIRSLRHHAGRSLVFGETPQTRLLGIRTYRLPGTVVRVDGRTLRSVLFDLQEGRCAISGEPLSVLLEATHVWPLEYGGPDDLGNRLLLAVDWHKLWERRLVAVDDDHRILVSDEIRIADPESTYLRFAGQPLRPRRMGAPYPDAANFAWQRLVFRGPAHRP